MCSSWQVSQSVCECGPGYYNIRIPQHERKRYRTIQTYHCVKCNPGSFKDHTGQDLCTLCEAGSLSTSNATACIPCPIDSSPSTYMTFCVCNAGYFTPSGLHVHVPPITASRIVALTEVTQPTAALEPLTEAPIAPPVPLGTAVDFVILTKAGISTLATSHITGDIGVSPIAATAITGFSLITDLSNVHSTSTQVRGSVYAPNYAVPTPSKMTRAISDMETAYTDASSRGITDQSNLNINAGLISGSTFTAGVYKWGCNVIFYTDIYIKGSRRDHFIFQITGNLVAGSGAKIILVDDGVDGMPNAPNIVWQVAGYIDAGTTSHLEGTLLGKTKIVFKTGSSLNGRILAQTACTLDNVIVA